MIKSAVLTFIQYAGLLAILFLNKWLVDFIPLLVVQGIGGLLAFWAIYEMRKGKLNIAPHVRKGAVLITSGPYRWIRHPMYLALLLTLIPMLSENQKGWNLLLFAVFIINLILKLQFEEGLLRNEFPEYISYSKHTARIIPGLF